MKHHIIYRIRAIDTTCEISSITIGCRYGQPGAAVVADGLTETREKRLLNWAEEIAALVSVQRDDLRRSRMELVAAQQACRDPDQRIYYLKSSMT